MFIACCHNGHLDLAQWIYENANEMEISFDIRANDDSAFKKAFDNWCWDTTDWLCTLCPYYEIETIDHKVNIIIKDKDNMNFF